MTTAFTSPKPFSPAHQHEVAKLDRATTLYHALPAQPEVLQALRGQHILSVKPFSAAQILELFRLAAGYEAGILSPAQLPAGTIMSNLFLDHTRPQIRLSFNYAWMKMGGSTINIEKTIQELMANRSSAYDEVAELCNISSDLAIVLTQEDGVLEQMLDHLRIPVINAGNGSDEHPSHGLADLYTLLKWRPDLLSANPNHPLHIAIIGDPSYTRTIRSFLFTLMKFPQMVKQIVIFERVHQPFQPGQKEELEAAGLTIELIGDLYPRESITSANRIMLPDLDVIYIHELKYIQQRRVSMLESKELLKPNALILNPEIQSQEFSDLINASPHNGYFAQARGASYVRMALLSALYGLH